MNTTRNNNIRILDRSNYTKRTLDTFEILGAYFIDIYYNHLYLEARKLKTNGASSSITEGYKHALNAFLHGVDNPKLYKKTLIGIHGFFLESGISSISFAECIERITEEFIPKDYYESVSKQQKISILKLVICQSNRVFMEKLVRKYIYLVIDNHNDPDNIRILQDEFIDILMIERQSMYHKFISIQTKTSKTPQIDIVLFESMQHEVKVLCKDKYELKSTIINLKKIILKKEIELRDEKEHSSTLNDKIDELTNELDELKAEFELSKEKDIEIKELKELNDNKSESAKSSEPDIYSELMDPAYNRDLKKIESFNNIINDDPIINEEHVNNDQSDHNADNEIISGKKEQNVLDNLFNNFTADSLDEF